MFLARLFASTICTSWALHCAIGWAAVSPGGNVKRVTIIGGGFAGLAAGVHLCDAGYTVTLLERRAAIGGGAPFRFTDPVTGDTVDNGQHLLMKCYRETLDFLERIGARDDVVFST